MNSPRYLVQIFLLFFSFTAITVNASPKIHLPMVKVDLGSVMHSEFGKGHFLIENRGDEPLKILDISSSCGCTIIDFEPDTLIAPGKKLSLEFSIDSAGKVGEVRKQITIKSNDPDNEEVNLYAYVRVKLKEHEKLDRSAIFKGNCATCHVRPGNYLFGEELFEAVCYMCHGHYGLGGLAKRINDYAFVTNFDNDYFRSKISEGVEGSSMPGFAEKYGGPLSEYQIESLVELMRWWEDGFVFKANEERRSNDL